MISQEKKKEILDHVKYLRLSGIKNNLEDSLLLAEKESLSYADFLLHIFEHESDVRKNNKISRLLKDSKLPTDKTLKSFELNRLPLKIRQKVNAILDGGFIDRKENILVFGQPGSGKTHLLCAIAHEQIIAGRKILFTSSSLFVQKLLIAKKNLELEKVLKQLSKYEAIILDDIGYIQQNREEMEVLFIFLADRYERGSIMITSNLPFSKWDKIFKDTMTTAAAIDRLVHHSMIIELNLKSYRTINALKKIKNKETNN